MEVLTASTSFFFFLEDFIYFFDVGHFLKVFIGFGTVLLQLRHMGS